MRKRQRKRFDHGEPIAKIDTRPLAFVALFLAIVFLVPAAQVKPHALLFDLETDVNWITPPTDGPDIIPGVIVVSPNEAGAVLWNCEATTFPEFSRLVRQAIATFAVEPVIVFTPSPNASYDLSAKVLKEIKASGATKLRFEGLEKHREFGSADNSKPSSSWSILSVATTELSIEAIPMEFPEKYAPKAFDEVKCEPNQF